MRTHWKIEIYLHGDDKPEPLTSKEIEAIVDSIDLPAGVKVTQVTISEGE